MLPVPQRYYVPGRIRDCFRPRLEAVGLWTQPAEPDLEKTLKKDVKNVGEEKSKVFAKAFEREKALQPPYF